MDHQRTLEKMKKLTAYLGITLALFSASISLVGCGEKEPEPSKETVVQSDRLTKIRESSGGDWDKVSEADKQWIITEVCFGNEGSAKMMISKAAKPTPGGGRPKTGP